MTKDELNAAELEGVAKALRKTVRQKAGLSLDWDRASDDMKDWYRQIAKKIQNGEMLSTEEN